MKKVSISILLANLLFHFAFAQPDNILYKKTSVMIPMRDGVKLYTVIFSPYNYNSSVPILIQRTPYSASVPVRDDSVMTIPTNSTYYYLAKEGYIFVFQDIRGKFKSEGTMQIHQPLIHTTQKGAVDESTDTWDTVDWLIKNI